MVRAERLDEMVAGGCREKAKLPAIASLELLSFGLTNRQIAGRLGVTQGTVRWYMRSLFGKLQVRNRVEALRRARQSLWV